MIGDRSERRILDGAHRRDGIDRGDLERPIGAVLDAPAVSAAIAWV